MAMQSSSPASRQEPCQDGQGAGPVVRTSPRGARFRMRREPMSREEACSSEAHTRHPPRLRGQTTLPAQILEDRGENDCVLWTAGDRHRGRTCARGTC
jgi:hypothetical protein